MTAVADEIGFGDFRLDLRAEALFRGDTGVPITPKALALLRHFVDHPGSLVTRDELFDRIWAGQVVTDGALSRCVRELRAALGDDVHQPRYLVTVHRKGYRFVAPVRNGSAAASSSNATFSNAALPDVPGEPFVGREASLKEAASYVHDAIRRRTGAVIEISGEPGAGKSRLMNALAAVAPSLGVRARVVHATESRGAPPFWMWIQLLRALDEPAGATSERIETLLGSKHRLAPPFADRGLAVERERFDIRQAVVRHVCAAADASPLLIIMEDIHAAEPDCLELLADLAQAIAAVPIVIAVTYRDVGAPRNDALKSCLAELTRSTATVRRMPMRGLGIEAVRTWLAAEMGDSGDVELAQLALDKTGGNPLYLRELFALSADATDRTPGSWAVHRPETVQQLLTRRLQLLTPTCLRVLERAAVIGNDFSLNLLLRCNDIDEDQILAALDVARLERLVTSVEVAHGRWRFSHGLVREVLYDRIDMSERPRHHLIVGGALEADNDGRNEIPYAQLALHFTRATRGGEQVRKASHYLWHAGRYAQASFAHNEAEAHFAALVNHIVRHLPEDRARLSEVWSARASCAANRGKPDVARQNAQRALTVARASNDVDALTVAVLTLCAVQPAYPAQPQLIELLDDVLTKIGEAQHAARARLLAQRAFQHFVGGNIEQMCSDARRAETSARHSGDDRTLESALKVLSYSFMSPHDDAERRAVYEERFAIARRLNDPFIEYSAQYSRFEHVLQLKATASTIDDELRRFEVCVQRVGLPTARAALLRAQAGVAIARGELDCAWTFAEQALQVGQASTDAATAHVVSLLHFGVLLSLKGQLGEISAAIEDDTEVAHNSLMRSGQIYVRCRSGDLVTARAMLDRLVASDLDLPRDMNYGLALCNLTLSCISLGHIEASARLFELLMPYRKRSATVLCYYYSGCCAQYLGLLAAVLGRVRDSVELFEEALAINETMGSKLWHADAALAYASVCERIGGAQGRRGEEVRRVAGEYLASINVLPANMSCGELLWAAEARR